MWLKVKYYKTGENRKLAPRRGGPWIVAERLPNGVNVRIRNETTKDEKIVHHDRLTPVRESEHQPAQRQPPIDSRPQPIRKDSESDTDSDDSTFRGDESRSDYDPSSDDVSSADSDVNDEQRRYPARDRRQRVIPGAIPWSSVARL